MIFCEWSELFAKFCEDVFKFIAVKIREICKDDCAFVFLKQNNTEINVITNHQTIADKINKYIVNVGKSMADLVASGSWKKSDSNSCVWTSKKVSNSIFLFQCSPQDVYNEIAILKIKKATRTSDIETKFNKYANPVISKFVSDLFNFCLKEGVYPDSLKVAKVIPIFKKGEQDKTTNYRPISLLSQFNKIFERLLYSRIYSYLVKYDLLSDCEFDFLKNSSPNFAIKKIYIEILSNIDQSLYTCCVFLGLSRGGQ